MTHYSTSVTGQLVDEIMVLCVDSPPVNALGFDVRTGLMAGITQAQADPAVAAVVIICAGSTFFAGADIVEFETGVPEPTLNTIFARLDAATKPVIAAIHGTALGGGLELAMACHRRIAVGQAALGLPEVQLGLLPGAGGTQRLPRLVGVAAATEIMLSGRMVPAREALAHGLIDRIADGDLRDAAIAYARETASEGAMPRTRDRPVDLDPAGAAAVFDRWRLEHPDQFRGFKAPAHIIAAIDAAVRLPFDDGRGEEARLFDELMVSRESAAQRHIFFAERAAAKVPDLPRDVKPQPVRKVVVLGGETESERLAETLQAGKADIDLVELMPAADGSIDASLKACRSSLVQADMVIDAGGGVGTVEDRMAAVSRLVRTEAVLAVSGETSTLALLSDKVRDPAQLVGLHFRSQPGKARLLEVQRTPVTSAAALSTALGFAKRLRLQLLVSKGTEGALHDRLAAALVAAAQAAGMPAGEPAAIVDACWDAPAEKREAVLLPLVNEAAAALSELAAIRASDIDAALVAAWNWPAYSGGPMFWCDSHGIDPAIASLEVLLGATAVSPLLRDVAQAKGQLAKA